MHERAFDETLQSFGLSSGAELAKLIGRSRKSSSRWRKSGFPESVRWKLARVAAEQGVDLPRCFFEPMADAA